MQKAQLPLVGVHRKRTRSGWIRGRHRRAKGAELLAAPQLVNFCRAALAPQRASLFGMRQFQARHTVHAQGLLPHALQDVACTREQRRRLGHDVHGRKGLGLHLRTVSCVTAMHPEGRRAACRRRAQRAVTLTNVAPHVFRHMPHVTHCYTRGAVPEKIPVVSFRDSP